MANVLGNLFADIANAIRSKTGGTDTMKPAEFPAEIASIVTGGGAQPQLNAPSLSRSGAIVTITNPSSNGSFVTSYNVFDGDNMLSSQTGKTLDISGFEFGEHLLTATALGDNFAESEKSAVLNASKYSVTLNLTNVTSDFSKAYVWHGESLTINLQTASSSFALPSEIDATMGGGADGIVYNKDSKTIVIISITGDISITIAAEEILTLEQTPWETIAQYADDGTLANRYSIGDTKNVTITSNDGNSYTIPFKIAAFNQDELADESGKAAVTFVADRALKIVNDWGNVGNYENYNTIPQRKLINTGGNIYMGMPESLILVVKPVVKTYVGGGVNLLEIKTVVDKFSLLSLAEVGLDGANGSQYALETGVPKYSIFTDNTSRLRKKSTSSSNVGYLLRDTSSEYVARMWAIDYTGVAQGLGYKSVVAPGGADHIVFSFCI